MSIFVCLFGMSVFMFVRRVSIFVCVVALSIFVCLFWMSVFMFVMKMSICVCCGDFSSRVLG